jgi:hypothetical protein
MMSVFYWAVDWTRNGQRFAADLRFLADGRMFARVFHPVFAPAAAARCRGRVLVDRRRWGRLEAGLSGGNDPQVVVLTGLHLQQQGLPVRIDTDDDAGVHCATTTATPGGSGARYAALESGSIDVDWESDQRLQMCAFAQRARHSSHWCEGFGQRRVAEERDGDDPVLGDGQHRHAIGLAAEPGHRGGLAVGLGRHHPPCSRGAH